MKSLFLEINCEGRKIRKETKHNKKITGRTKDEKSHEQNLIARNN